MVKEDNSLIYSVCVWWVLLLFIYFSENVQAVRELYEIVPARKWEREENRMNKIVFIGNQMNFVPV